MKKFLIASMLFLMPFGTQAITETKKNKIEQYFDLYHDQEKFTKIYEPLFIGANITDESIKKAAIEKYFTILKQDYIVAYDKFFSESNIDEILKFYKSQTGKKFIENTSEIGAALTNSSMKFMTILQEISASKNETENANPDSSKVLTVVAEVKVAQETKLSKVEQLFNLTQVKDHLIKMYEPLFVGANITDASVKKNAIEKYIVIFKKDYIEVYDKLFTEQDIAQMLEFNLTDTGKKVFSFNFELGPELANSYGKISTIIEELSPKANAQDAVTKIKSDAVVHFNDIAKDKTDLEIKELFSKEIQHDGLTVAKFSAEWCGPCKAYAPIFEKVAEQAKEINRDANKPSVKFIDIDIDNARIIAQDNSVLSVPTTIFYKNGKKVESKIGLQQKSDLENSIKNLTK